MAPTSVQLQDDQRFALMKFRRSVYDVLEPHHDDYFLLRWLRARSWEPAAAEKMLRESLEWRKRWEVDSGLKAWKAPEVLVKYYPSGQAGFDKDGAPVVILPFAGLDIWGLLHTIPKQDIIKKTILVLEEYLRIAKGTGTNQVTIIVDMEGFNLKQYAWRPAGELVITLIQMYEMNYPEILKDCYIVNAPSVFALAFSIVKKFLNEYTISKMQIFKNDRRKWIPVLRDRIQPQELPEHYGGDLVDPDGDPRCPSKIKLGGKVPKSLYNKNQLEKTDNEEFKTAIIKKGKQMTLDFIVAEEGCALKWEFRSEDHDIKFGVTCRDNEGDESEVVALNRVSCQHASEVGVVACNYPATYTVIFDNTYSILRSKKVHYNIHLTIPFDKLDIVTLPEVESAQDALSIES